jgi:predicted HNH restriction endonuclease
MYWYAAYGDTPAPEKTVKTFYQAYFDRDFDTVAQNLSVFWSVRFLPEYADMSPEQLIENRTKIEGDISKIIADIEKENSVPKGVSIEVMKEYTKIGKNSAIVVYTFKENGKETGMETALLIKEKGQLRIFNMSPIDPQTLEQIKAVDINVLDENFDSLLKTAEPK